MYEIESIFLLTTPEHTMITSTIVRDIIRHGGDASQFVPAVQDPEAYKLGIIKYTVETLLTNIKDVVSVECMENIIIKIHEIDEELSNVSI